ncbi:hypothetical protein L0Y65_03740 [Candidatus Micrarchaeota archaeon]|nr:hypothetical protein [Candidatus Micrarchaeota archaeon]
MTLRALFEKERNDEKRNALRQGRPIEFMCRKPHADGPIDGGTPAEGGAFVISCKEADGGVLKMEMAYGGSTRPFTLEAGKETEIGLPDGRTIRLMGQKAGDNTCTISVDVNP